MNERKFDVEALPRVAATEVEALPLPVVPDWDEQVRQAGDTCRLIDRHLEYELRCRTLRDGEEFAPRHLCPEQRVQMVTDLYAVTR
jgi:hypothetical protein